jgi:hypothetical protein
MAYTARWAPHTSTAIRLRVVVLGEYPTLEDAAEACRQHAQARPLFLEIVDEAYDDDGGYDLVTHVGRDLEIYHADPA